MKKILLISFLLSGIFMLSGKSACAEILNFSHQNILDVSVEGHPLYDNPMPNVTEFHGTLEFINGQQILTLNLQAEDYTPAFTDEGATESKIILNGPMVSNLNNNTGVLQMSGIYRLTLHNPDWGRVIWDIPITGQYRTINVGILNGGRIGVLNFTMPEQLDNFAGGIFQMGYPHGQIRPEYHWEIRFKLPRRNWYLAFIEYAFHN